MDVVSIPLRGSPAAGLSHEAFIPDPEHSVLLGVIGLRGALRCQDVPGRAHVPITGACLAWGTHLHSYMQQC